MTRYFIATQGLNRETGQWETLHGEAYLAADYDRLQLDNLSKNGTIKALGAQVAALQRAVKNRDNLKDQAEAERDEARRVLGNCQERLDPHSDAVLWGEVVRALGLSKC